MRIFLVDDADDLRVLVRTWLDLGTSHTIVGEASNIDEALQRLPESAPDVIVTDLVMGAGGGAGQLVAELRAAAPNARLIVLSGHDPVGLELPPGVDRYVIKGGGLDALIEAISDLS
jgi:DNA-binding NarL/FixJ family response regulator